VRVQVKNASFSTDTTAIVSPNVPPRGRIKLNPKQTMRALIRFVVGDPRIYKKLQAEIDDAVSSEERDRVPAFVYRRVQTSVLSSAFISTARARLTDEKPGLSKRNGASARRGEDGALRYTFRA
jgi:hypothetical protein